jgi:hypothetical protein
LASMPDSLPTTSRNSIIVGKAEAACHWQWLAFQV